MKKLALILSLFVFAACAQTGGQADMTTYADLQGKAFVLDTFNGRQIKGDVPARQPRIEFGGDMNVYGQMCNNYSGRAALENGQIKMMAASTMMLCASDELNKAESAFYSILGEGADISLDGKKLTIKKGSNKFIFNQK